ncbi:putative protein S-acyltransferase 14 [Orobanche minor]
MQRVQQRVWRLCDDGFTAATIQHTVGDAIMELFFSCIYISALFVSRRCILKMDHHCVWVVNYVGALNYKYFLLFLFYTFLETTLVTLSLLPLLLSLVMAKSLGLQEVLQQLFLLLNLAFALSVMGFLIMHISLVAANTMTIEDYEKKTTPEWCYDLRRMINFQQTKGAPGNTVLAGVAPPMCSTDEAYDSISLTC